MKKNALFSVLNGVQSADVICLGDMIEARRNVSVIKMPQKMLVMLKVRESAKNTLFYAGEALACECTVAIEGVKGYAACLGDDVQKVRAMAVIDAALNAELPERSDIIRALGNWKRALAENRSLESRLTMSTKVNFTVMEE